MQFLRLPIEERFAEGRGAPTEGLPPFSNQVSSPSPAIWCRTCLCGGFGAVGGVAREITVRRKPFSSFASIARGTGWSRNSNWLPTRQDYFNCDWVPAMGKELLLVLCAPHPLTRPLTVLSPRAPTPSCPHPTDALPFLHTPNPLAALIAYLTSLVSPQVGAAAARAAMGLSAPEHAARPSLSSPSTLNQWGFQASRLCDSARGKPFEE